MKNYILLGFLLFFSLMFINFASALYLDNLTIISPATSGIMGNSIIFNVSYNFTLTTTTYTIESNVSMSHFYLRSPSTANSSSSFIFIGSVGNLSYPTAGGLTYFVFNYTNLSGFEDANDYVFNVTMGNNTVSGNNITLTRTGLTNDNTVPQEPTSLTSGLLSNSTPMISLTITGVNTTSCLLFYTKTVPGINKILGMAHTGNTCTLGNITYPELSYYYIVQAGDGTNFTNSSEATINVNLPGGLHPDDQLDDRDDSTKGLFGGGIGGLIVVILLIIGIVWLVRRSRK